MQAVRFATSSFTEGRLKCKEIMGEYFVVWLVMEYLAEKKVPVLSVKNQFSRAQIKRLVVEVALTRIGLVLNTMSVDREIKLKVREV